MQQEKRSNMSFVHLHVHTEYSIDGMSNIRCLFEKAAKLEMPGLAITDHGTIAGVPAFLDVAEDFPTVKPIVGCECWLGDPSRTKTYHLILLAKNLIGYRNLVKLCNIANSEGMYPKDARPHISAASLAEHREGLICTSACIGGEIPQLILDGDMAAAKEAAVWYKSIFGDDFYLEVALHRNFGPVKLSDADNRLAYLKSNRKLIRLQKISNAGIFEIARELGIKVVATNDIHYVDREDAIAHDVMRAIQHKKRMDDPNRIRFSHLEYMKTEEEMRRLFPEHPEVIDNTLEVLDKVERYSIWEDLEIPQVCENPDETLREAVFEGAAKRFGELSPAQSQRLEEELRVIGLKKFSSYLLIIKDIVDWARSKDLIVGPGRGSAPGSIVNYCLGITNIDPMKHGLLSERFLNRWQKTLPGIDLDMEPNAREKVFGYLKEKYGVDHVAEITSYERFGEKGAKRAVAKKLGKSQEANAVAEKLSWVINNQHLHACSILFSAQSLSGLVPLRNGASEYEGNWTDAIGVLRLNFLGLRALRIPQDIMYAIERQEGILIEPEYLPLDDPDALELYAKGDTVGIFMFEAEGIKQWLRDTRPSSFSDLVAMEALYRPGSLVNVPVFADLKNGRKPVAYIIPELEDILGDTYGLVVYQEQQMQICERLAGFTPEAADRLRRAFGKRKYQDLDDIHEAFIEGGVRNGYDRDALEKVWMNMNHWYAFNKSHALCYTWISYQMAWYKAIYPEEFFEVLLNSYMDQQEELDRILADAAAHKVHVITPDKTESGLFEVVR